MTIKPEEVSALTVNANPEFSLTKPDFLVLITLYHLDYNNEQSKFKPSSTPASSRKIANRKSQKMWKLVLTGKVWPKQTYTTALSSAFASGK